MPSRFQRILKDFYYHSDETDSKCLTSHQEAIYSCHAMFCLANSRKTNSIFSSEPFVCFLHSCGAMQRNAKQTNEAKALGILFCNMHPYIQSIMEISPITNCAQPMFWVKTDEYSSIPKTSRKVDFTCSWCEILQHFTRDWLNQYSMHCIGSMECLMGTMGSPAEAMGFEAARQPWIETGPRGRPKP